MRKHKILYLILSLLLLLFGYLGYRRWHIQLVDSQEKPACLWLKTDSSPFLILDLHRQFQPDASMKILETQFWTEKMIPIITAPSKITASYTSYQLPTESGETARFYVNEHPINNHCGLSFFYMQEGETLRETETAVWVQFDQSVSDPDSSNSSVQRVWQMRSSEVEIIIKFADSLTDSILPAAEKTFAQLAS